MSGCSQGTPCFRVAGFGFVSATLHPEDLPPGQVVGSAAGEPVIVSVIEFNEEAVLAIGTRGPTIPDGPREHLFDPTMRGTWSSDHLGLEIAKESCARTAVGSN